MQRARPYLKVAAVVSSACLVAAFVAYRAGAFDSPPTPALEPEAQPEIQPPVPPYPANLTEHVFMSGSKSTFVYDESALKALEMLTANSSTVQTVPPTGTQSTPPAKPVFLGGSKSLAPIFGPSTTGPGSAEKSSPPAPPAPVPPKKGE
jgi:hypothetical protein